ncbi:polyhydroxyalkanoate depolymerase [Erythrobacter sp. SG61-1L]|uniref:DoxX family protein n=1 Tax=Erythrobacter sp. SG61-1L TaxID=1603897 RepID=UPI0006C9125A|nr:DoxX family protein [Erythrobacter sp. SG61-1L]KPL67035.1 polyhydroxyalkanoate depolymerase [Erythrobacter sp. SG61-1L]
MTARQMTVAGWVLTGLFALFMLGASITPKLLGMDAATQTLAGLGWQPGSALMIGGFELAFLLLYLFPRTSVLGAVLMTALIGGAMATHIRVGSPLFSHTLFGIYLSLFMWGGLWLRLPALRALFPFTAKGA